jgi:hypothetical protein
MGRIALMGPVYLRGLAYLEKRDGTAAADEFRRILAHRGVDPFSIFYRLAPLGLARALALSGDTAGSLQLDDEFLAGWNRADPGLPLLATVRAERDRLAARVATETR